MYPAQTSLIPIHIALARFLENEGIQAIFSNYPYWYLGTTPFRFLTGPIMPGLLVLLHKALPFLNLFEIFYFILIASFLIGGVGVFIFIKSLIDTNTATKITNGKKEQFGNRLALLSALLFMFFPIALLLFSFSDGVHIIAFNLLPLVLWQYTRLLKKQRNLKNELFLIITITFVILTDTLMINTLVMGMLITLFSIKGWQRIEANIKYSLKILIFALLLATWWYTPAYWWQILVAPSFSGKPLFAVIGQLAKLFPVVLALFLALFSGKLIKLKQPAVKFCFSWLFVFGFLTLMRFIADPDFWLDWTAYSIELQFGFSIFGGLLINKWFCLDKYQKLKIKNKNDISKIKSILSLVCIFAFYFLIFTIVFKTYVLDYMRRNIEDSVEYKIGKKLSEVIKEDQKVFLSGTTVFWLNAFFDIRQVRGGNDRVSVNSDWRKAAWEIREGLDVQKSLKWLKELRG